MSSCIVVGLGAMGSAATYHLARRGVQVLGLESQRFAGHGMGSSGGLSRIWRLCYHEGHEYVPLLKRSYKLFLDLEHEIGETLLHHTGMLDIGPTAPKAQHAACMHSLEHELLDGAEVSRRYPGYSVPSDWPALFQPLAGILLPEKCIQAHCRQAQSHPSCNLQFGPGAQVVSWRPTGQQSGVEVHTADGAVHQAAHLVFSSGAWAPKLLPELQGLCVPVRQAVGWFTVDSAARQRGAFQLHRFPCFIVSQGEDSWYGFPEHGDQPGFKIGKYNHLGEVVDPDSMERSMTAADEDALRKAVRQFFPAANGPLLETSTCLFTNLPDGRFLIDRHPFHPQVTIVSACSGHAFKISSGIGMHVAELVLDGLSDNSEAGQELALHRFNVQRPGHAGFMERAEQAAASRMK